ncbi:MAG: hypothetical protein D3922_08805, partial [Candidatus Electrothrix sp. AR1]|nr:hypothetical protein [Candidatus Electrothrix sp. AR1]
MPCPYRKRFIWFPSSGLGTVFLKLRFPKPSFCIQDAQAELGHQQSSGFGASGHRGASEMVEVPA